MNELRNNNQDRCAIQKRSYYVGNRVLLVLLFGASGSPSGLMGDAVSADVETGNEEAPVEIEYPDKEKILKQMSECTAARADTRRTSSDHGDIELDDFFDPGSYPVTKPKLSKPSRIEVWGRTIGIYVLHKVMGFTDWFKKLLSPKEKKHGKAKAKGKAKKRSA